MSEPAKTPDSANGADAAEGKAQRRQARKFTPDELLSHARSVSGHPRAVIVGALAIAEQDESKRETYTRAQAKKLGDDFLKREVEVDPALTPDEEKDE